MIDSVSRITPEGVESWTWESMPESVKADIELAIILKEGK